MPAAAGAMGIHLRHVEPERWDPNGTSTLTRINSDPRPLTGSVGSIPSADLIGLGFSEKSIIIVEDLTRHLLSNKEQQLALSAIPSTLVLLSPLTDPGDMFIDESGHCLLGPQCRTGSVVAD